MLEKIKAFKQEIKNLIEKGKELRQELDRLDINIHLERLKKIYLKTI